MTRVVLTHPHTHAGTSHLAGDAIDVDPGTAHWLIAQAIAAPESQPARAEPPSAKTETLQRKDSKQ